MAILGFPLASSLGGGLFPPFVVNLLPAPGEEDFNLTDLVRMTIRDAETYVDASTLRISVGYALVRGEGDEFFDEDSKLPNTFFSSVTPGSVSDEEADLALVAEGVQITKTTAGAQESVAFTPIESGIGFPSTMVTAVMRPDIITIGETGAVLGLEHGPRNTACYLFLESVGGLPQIRIAGPADGSGTRVPDRAISYDWSSLQRYIIVWNEVLGNMELYSVLDGETSLLTSEPIANFQQFDTSGNGTPSIRKGGDTELSAVYGIEGALGDRVTIGNVAVTRNVAYPVIGVSRPGQFETVRKTDEIIRYEGGDPRDLDISPWFGPPDNSLLPNPDTSGGLTVLSNGCRVSKVTASGTYGLNREEPGFLSSSDNGFILEAEFSALPVQKVGDRITGMGFLIYDGQNAFFLSLIDGAERKIGLLEAGGDPTTVLDFFLAVDELDWSSQVGIRFVFDPRREKIDLYFLPDITTPVLSRDLDRDEIADLTDLGYSDFPASIQFGHINDLATAGSFNLYRLLYSHLYQAWEAVDGLGPDVLPTDPQWFYATTGFEIISPLNGGLHFLGGGFGPTPLGYYVQSGTGAAGATSFPGDGTMELVCDPGETLTYYRTAPFDDQRGAVIEASLQITDYKPRSRSGVFLVLDDGLKAYMLSFVDTDIGRFVGVTVSSGLNSFIEKVGPVGEGEKYSFEVDWTEPHVYRMERRPQDGLYIFVDQETEPSLVLLDREDRPSYPGSQFLSPTVAFGALSQEGSTSKWSFVRTMFGSGYEVSFRRNLDTPGFEEELKDSQAIIVVSADDV